LAKVLVDSFNKFGKKQKKSNLIERAELTEYINTLEGKDGVLELLVYSIE
jgi:hypothetical protein